MATNTSAFIRGEHDKHRTEVGDHVYCEQGDFSTPMPRTLPFRSQLALWACRLRPSSVRSGKNSHAWWRAMNTGPAPPAGLRLIGGEDKGVLRRYQDRAPRDWDGSDGGCACRPTSRSSAPRAGWRRRRRAPGSHAWSGPPAGDRRRGRETRPGWTPDPSPRRRSSATTESPTHTKTHHAAARTATVPPIRTCVVAAAPFQQPRRADLAAQTGEVASPDRDGDRQSW